MTNNRLSWIETEFSPAEFAAASGLNGEMQRHWRRRGLLPEKSGRIASFTAHDIATVRLMVLLGQPLKTRTLAEQLAPHVIWLALGGNPASWKVDGPEDDANAYRHELEMGHSHIDLMAGISARDLNRYVIIADENEPVLVPSLHEDVLGGGTEISTVIDLNAVAAKFVRALNDKPLATIMLPKRAKGRPRA